MIKINLEITPDEVIEGKYFDGRTVYKRGNEYLIDNVSKSAMVDMGESMVNLYQFLKEVKINEKIVRPMTESIQF